MHAHDHVGGRQRDSPRSAPRASGPSRIQRGRRVDRERHLKLERLRSSGRDPFPDAHLPQRSLAAHLHASHDPHLLAPGEHRQARYVVAGRLVARRKHRHATFLDLRDVSGVIELCAMRQAADRVEQQQLLDADIGDIVAATGHLYVTDNHRLTLCVTSASLLAKALRAPPTPRDAGTAGRRRRELDLLADQRTHTLYKLRSTASQAIRRWMSENAFIELDSPATPRRDLPAQTANRLHLRRCLLGGLERVYRMGRPWQAGGRSGHGHPEPTMLEWSAAYTDVGEAARQARALILQVADAVLSELPPSWRAEAVDLHGPWRTTTLRECIVEQAGLDIVTSDASTLARRLGASPGHPPASWSALVDDLYATLVRPKLEQPTIVLDLPLAGHALTRRHPVHRQLASCFEVVGGGIALASGDSELNDPDEQRTRVIEQGPNAADAHTLEQEIHLIEYGLCPAASATLTLDRLIMLLTASQSLHEVIP